MTTFWRDGFYRTNSYGTTFWVEGHWVDRYDWDRSQTYQPAIQTSGTTPRVTSIDYLSALKKFRAAQSCTAQHLSPNAECPVCGKEVFFYQNEHGSRVFFDELGPPWPKHPCTDISSAAVVPDVGKTIQPSFRTSSLARVIGICNRKAQTNTAIEFVKKYGTPYSTPWLVNGRFSAAGGALLVLTKIGDEKLERAYVSATLLGNFLEKGMAAYLEAEALYFFDMSTMQPVATAVHRFDGAKDFVEALIE